MRNAPRAVNSLMAGTFTAMKEENSGQNCWKTCENTKPVPGGWWGMCHILFLQQRKRDTDNLMFLPPHAIA